VNAELFRANISTYTFAVIFQSSPVHWVSSSVLTISSESWLEFKLLYIVNLTFNLYRNAATSYLAISAVNVTVSCAEINQISIALL
jgi:hypothetical protein